MNKKKIEIIVIVSFWVVALLTTIIFCSVYFSVDIDLEKQIDKFFAEDEITYYFK